MQFVLVVEQDIIVADRSSVGKVTPWEDNVGGTDQLHTQELLSWTHGFHPKKKGRAGQLPTWG